MKSKLIPLRFNELLGCVADSITTFLKYHTKPATILTMAYQSMSPRLIFQRTLIILSVTDKRIVLNELIVHKQGNLIILARLLFSNLDSHNFQITL